MENRLQLLRFSDDQSETNEKKSYSQLLSELEEYLVSLKNSTVHETGSNVLSSFTVSIMISFLLTPPTSDLNDDYLRRATLEALELALHKAKMSKSELHETKNSPKEDLEELSIPELAARYADAVRLPEKDIKKIERLSTILCKKIKAKACTFDSLETVIEYGHELIALRHQSEEWIRFVLPLIHESSARFCDFSLFDIACLLSRKKYMRFLIQEHLEELKQKSPDELSLMLKKTQDLFTPLNAVMQAGSKSTAKVLVKFGADICFASESGETPLMVASANGMDSCVEWLLKKLSKSARENPTLLADELNRCNKDGICALDHAVANGHEKVVRQLLEKGSLIRTKDGALPPLLFTATEKGNVKVVGLLLDHGTDVNVKSDDIGILNSAIACCGIGESEDSIAHYSEQEKQERRAIFSLLLNHANLNKQAIDWDDVITSAQYYGLANIKEKCETKKNGAFAEETGKE